MKFIPKKALKIAFAAMALSAILTGCAAPQQGKMFYDTSNAIRAAQNAGALEFAPEEYTAANENYRKAEAMLQKRRSNRAQKLLELATAQASLAQTISEAAQAESNLSYLRTGSIR